MNLAATFKPAFTRSSQGTEIGNSWLSGVFGSATKNGVAVNANSALTLSAFYNAIDIITNDFAKLPKAVFQKIEGDRNKIGDHPVNYLISTRPNQYMTPFMFNKMRLQQAILKGNSYAVIERNPNTSTPIALQLIDQEKTPVTVLKHNSKLFYKFGGRIIPADDMLHVPGFSFNGITGIGIVSYAAKSLGVSLSSQEFAEDYYNKKGIGYGVVTSATEMDSDAKIRYGKAMSEVFSGNSSDFKVAVADEMNGFQHISISPQEAQFLATNKYGIEEVARWLNIPPHKLKSLDNVNNSITENQELQHISDSILPWAIKFEQEDSIKLFSGVEQRAGFYIKSNEGALLRSDKKTQAEFFSKLIFSGVYTPNEVRHLLELNSLEGLDAPLRPVNLQALDQIEAKLKELESKP